MAEIEAKVARVLSSKEIAVNVGSDSGIAAGDRIYLYDDQKIYDPDTNVELGVVSLVALRFRVTEVWDRFSTGVVMDLAEGERPAFTIGVPDIMRPRKTKSIREAGETEKSDVVRVDVGQTVIVYTQDREEESE